jgi:hypothetical protein
MSLFDRGRQVIDQLASLTEVDWRRPDWWGFAAGALVLDHVARSALGREDKRHLYLSANGGPRADNYMGRPSPPSPRLHQAVARAVVRARAAVEAIAHLDGSLPEQPLAVVLTWERGWLWRRPVAGRRVAFVTAAGTYLADLQRDSDEAVATALGAVLAARPGTPWPRALHPVDPLAVQPTPAAVAVTVGGGPLHFVQHLHRTAWTAGAGPWLGVGEAAPLEAVTTCHVVVDGYGHAQLSREIFARVDARDLAPLCAAARLGLGGDGGALPAVAPPAGASALSFAGELLADGAGNFAQQSYAFGRALDRVFRAHLFPAQRCRFGFSPSFQVPVAPGAPSDPQRRKRRVTHGLLALRQPGGVPESLAEFQLRLPEFLRRELAADSLLPQLALGAASAPLPLRWRRWLLQSRHRSHARVPAYEVLAGRGRFSSMKFPPGERPLPRLYAVSSPTLLVTPDDPLGAVVLTLIHHDQGCTATASGTGLVGSDPGAARFLAIWREELAIVRAHDTQERSGSAAERVRRN